MFTLKYVQNVIRISRENRNSLIPPVWWIVLQNVTARKKTLGNNIIGFLSTSCDLTDNE